MGRAMWILLALIAALSIATIWRDQQGLPAPSHTLCKESLVIQIFTGACTLRLTGETTPT
jgi:hypothetical protein